MGDFKLEVFKSEKFGEVKVLLKGNDYYFLANNVCNVLGYSNSRDAIRRHCDIEDVVKHDTPTNSGIQKMTYINESGLYSLILGSKLKQAKEFKKWVTSEVLPTIRKTGMYMTDNVWDNLMNDPTKFGEMLIEYGKVREENKRLNKTIEEQAPKIEFTDNVLQSENVVTITVIAKQYGTSAIAFNKLLHKLGVQYKVGKVWVLYDKYANMGYTKIITQLDSNGEPREISKWTQKGREFLYNLLKEIDILPVEV